MATLASLKAATGGTGLTDGSLVKRVNQLGGLKMLLFTSGGSISAGVLGTVTRSDGVSNTLRVDAITGGETGNFLFIESARRSPFTGGPVFDLKVHATDATKSAKTVSAVNTTTEVLTTSTAHGLKTGDPIRFLNSGGALPTGLSAAAMYFAIVVSTTTLKVATTSANAAAGTAVDITGAGSGTNTLRAMATETFTGLSMLDSADRYAERVVNGKSKWVVVVDLDSVNAEDRPSDTTTAVALATGAGEQALTGLARGDVIVGGINLTTPAIVTAIPTDTDKFVLTGASTLANADKVVFFVWPKAA